MKNIAGRDSLPGDWVMCSMFFNDSPFGGLKNTLIVCIVSTSDQVYKRAYYIKEGQFLNTTISTFDKFEVLR